MRESGQCMWGCTSLSISGTMSKIPTFVVGQTCGWLSGASLLGSQPVGTSVVHLPGRLSIMGLSPS